MFAVCGFSQISKYPGYMISLLIIIYNLFNIKKNSTEQSCDRVLCGFAMKWPKKTELFSRGVLCSPSIGEKSADLLLADWHS
jgi:hypothetical protein